MSPGVLYGVFSAKIRAVLRSHYRNYGEHKGLAVLNSELSKLSP